MSCLHGAHAMQKHQWHHDHIMSMRLEWNVNLNDIMTTWFSSHVSPSDIMLGMLELCMHAVAGVPK